MSAVAYRQYVLPESDRKLREYFFSRHFCTCVMGPLGCGKTVAGLQRFIRLAKLQAPHPLDGVRRTRWASIRGTYRDLERTHIKTWNEWWPRDLPFGEWKGGGNGEPASHKLTIPLPDGTVIETEVLFVAIGEHSIEEVAGGWELTGAHIGEAAELPEDVYFKLLERVGRYPRVDRMAGFAGASYSGVWLDCNAPNYGSHIERNFVTKPREGFHFVRLPGGLDPDAENLHNLIGGRRYYERIAAASPDHYVRRMVHNQFGFDRAGKPVYPEYDPFRHFTRQTLYATRGLKLVAGLDQGQKAAVVFGQRMPNRQIRLLRELMAFNVGGKEFGRMVRDFAREQFPGFEVEYVCDPAAKNRTDTSKDDDDVWMRHFEDGADEIVKTARTNKRAAREAVFREAMKTSIDGMTPGLLVDPSMMMTHTGLNQMHRYKKVSASGQPERYSLELDKTDENHVCEAAEYCSMELASFGEVMGRGRYSHVRDDVADEHWRPPGF